MSNEKIFVTYAWDDSTNDKVYSFVDMLKKEGFDAWCDRSKMQEETISNFSEIMTQGLNSDFVVVVLSEKYKVKAEAGQGGVGVEYIAISQDIAKNKKYIFVSFDKLIGDKADLITPKLYAGYYIIDLVQDQSNDFNELFSKLSNVPLIKFSDVGISKPVIKTNTPSPFVLEPNNKKCMGYGDNEGCCIFDVTNPIHKLCEKCFSDEFCFTVIDIYKTQGYKIEKVLSKPLDFIAILEYGSDKFTIYVKTIAQYQEKFDMNIINDISNIVSDTQKETGILVKDFSVISRHTLPKVASDAIISLGCTIKTENEIIQKLMNFSCYFESICNEYKKSELYKHYIDVYTTRRELLKDIVDDFINNSQSKNALLILGDYGCGKTSFCMSLTYTLIKKYTSGKSPYLPILVYLKEYTKAISIDNLFTNLLINQYNVNNGNIQTFYKLLKYSKVVLIFDGFDEIAKRVDFDVKFEVYKQICKYSFPNTKIILTCRTNFFQNENDYKALFERAHLHFEPNDSADLKLTKIHIDDFTPKQIQQYIESFSNKIAESGVTLKAFEQTLKSTHDLMDLARRPFMLGIIVKTLPELLRKNRSTTEGQIINAANLYKSYTDIWLEREQKKGKVLIKHKDKLVFCENLAFQMFVQNETYISYNDLPLKIRQHFKHLSDVTEIDYFSHDIQSCSFLNSTIDGRFDFIHKSFMEYFVACVVTRKLLMLNENEDENERFKKITNILGHNYLSTEICLFTKEILENNRNFDKLRLYNVFKDTFTDSNEILQNNILSLIAKFKLSFIDLIDEIDDNTINNTDLSFLHEIGGTIENMNFDNVSFFNSNLQNIYFINCTFRNCIFDNSEINQCYFDKTIVENSSFLDSGISKTRFSYCALVDADFSDAIFDDCVFLEADLSGHIVDEYTRFNNCAGLDEAIGAPYFV